jgi:hypothetical protein
MQRKLLGIINVDFDTKGQLQVIYSAFNKCLRKNGNTMRQYISFLDFRKAYDSLKREVYITLSIYTNM